LSEIPSAGKKVATLTLPDLYHLIKHDSIEVTNSRSANQVLKKIWRNFASLHSLHNPDLDKWLEIDFPSYATFEEAREAICEAETALNRGYERHVQSPGTGRISDLRRDLLSLLLHRAVQNNWEFSATSHFDSTRYRLPLALLENRHFKLDDDWHSGRFGCIDFLNIHVHCHDLQPTDVGYDRVDLTLGQRLPRLLTNAQLWKAIRTASGDDPGLLEHVTMSYIERHDLLKFHPRTVSSEVTGRIYAQPFRNGPERRGPKSKMDVTRRIFLNIAGQHLDAESLDTVIGKINDVWKREFSSESAPPKNVRTIRDHLRQLRFWTENGWDMLEILAAKSRHDSAF
jgi:hypothetical protein